MVLNLVSLCNLKFHQKFDDLCFEWIDYLCPHINVWCAFNHNNPCVDTIKISGCSKFFYVISLYTNFIFETISHCSLSYCCCSVASSSHVFQSLSCRPWSVFSFFLFYYKEAVVCKLCILSAGASHLPVTCPGTFFKLPTNIDIGTEKKEEESLFYIVLLC